VSVGESTYGFVEKHAADEIVEDLADLGVVFDVALVALDEFVLARAQVGQRLVVKVNVLFHL